MDRMTAKPYTVYARTDGADRITAVHSDAFLTDTAGWTEIDSGYGDRYHHAQGNYFDRPLMDERGVFRYRLVDRKPVERAQAEMDAEWAEIPPVEPAPDLTEKVTALEKSNRELQEALALLLSGEVE